MRLKTTSNSKSETFGDIYVKEKNSQILSLSWLDPTPNPRPYPLKIFLNFFAKIVLLRKQSLDFRVVFPLKFSTKVCFEG